MENKGFLNVFIDTEFTSLVDPVLISMGMVSSRGDELYFEVPFPIEKCSSFVCETVLPLLGREPNSSVSLDGLRLHIFRWLEGLRQGDEEIHICTDYQADWDLFFEAMGRQLPPWMQHRPLRSSDINKLLRYSFHKTTGLPEHHALYDARANRYAYRPRTR